MAFVIQIYMLVNQNNGDVFASCKLEKSLFNCSQRCLCANLVIDGRHIAESSLLKKPTGVYDKKITLLLLINVTNAGKQKTSN